MQFQNCITDDQRWQQLLLRITMQRNRIIQNRSQTFYENLLKGRLKQKLSETIFSSSSSFIVSIHLQSTWIVWYTQNVYRKY